MRGNAVGAGDATLAGLIAATLQGETWPEAVRRAVACGAAATHSQVAGDLGVDSDGSSTATEAAAEIAANYVDLVDTYRDAQ